MTTKLIYIAGDLRSGSTILGAALGALPGAVSLGEARLTLEWDPLRRCACGKPLAECEFWSPVGAYVRRRSSSAERAQPIEHARVRQIVLHRAREKWMARRHAQAAARMDDLYAAAAAESGATLLVDTSKHAAFAWVAQHIATVDTLVVHLVRDPRAVARAESRANSWAERAPFEPHPPPVHSATVSATAYQLMNSACLSVQRHAARGSWLTVRYEDFVRDPRTTLERIAAAHGLAVPDGLIDPAGSITLPAAHEAAGNPNRFGARRRRIAISDSGSAQLGRLGDAAVSVIASSSLHRYGYSARSRRAAAGIDAAATAAVRHQVVAR